MLGPIFERELTTLPRRGKHYIGRVVFCLSLFVLLCTAWLLMAGIQQIRDVGDFARFGSLVFQILAPLQLVILTCVAALGGVSSIAHEKDRKTLLLLLMTSLRNDELVLGKSGGGFLIAINLFLSGLPVLAMLTLLGGVTTDQVLVTAWITLATILASTSIGATIAFWREKTFQSLALTILIIVLWTIFCEAISVGAIAAISPDVATILNPFRAVWLLSRPIPVETAFGAIAKVGVFSGVWMFVLSALLLTLSIVMLRVWNPSREARPRIEEDSPESDAAVVTNVQASPGGQTREQQVKAWKSRNARRVWNNPVLWREMRTWAYGRKVLIIRFAYLFLAAILGFGLYRLSLGGAFAAVHQNGLNEELLPASAKLLAPFGVISLVIINALAVNSIVNERDGQALDLLLVTEITPPSFIFGKLLGILYVCKEMVIAPIAICIYLWWLGGLTTENLVFLIGGLVILDLFVSMLGIHCGIIYYRSRTAIATSLGTVFFLFLGIVTCMLIMISFQGSFSRQLAPFLAVIVGGGLGLFYALGMMNPSPAITISAFLLPFLTFFSLTSFILPNQELTVFSVIATVYGFTTLAMLIPAITEFDFALGKTPVAEETEG